MTMERLCLSEADALSPPTAATVPGEGETKVNSVSCRRSLVPSALDVGSSDVAKPRGPGSPFNPQHPTFHNMGVHVCMRNRRGQP